MAMPSVSSGLTSLGPDSSER